MPPETRRDIAIVGDRASLYCDFQKMHILLRDYRHEKQSGKCIAFEGETRGIPVEPEEPLTTELKAFLNSVRDRSKQIGRASCRERV